MRHQFYIMLRCCKYKYYFLFLLKILSTHLGCACLFRIDDIEDSSPLRRGQPAAHTIYGTAQTLNSANYMYFRALQRLQDLGACPEIQEIYLEEMCNLHRGQGWELYWRDNNCCPSLNEYILMVHHSELRDT